MAELDLESEQIRLKCIRKEGFFTVPPEHRVRGGHPGSSARFATALLGRNWGVSCRAAAPKFPARAGATVPEFPAAGAQGGEGLGLGRAVPGDLGVRGGLGDASRPQRDGPAPWEEQAPGSSSGSAEFSVRAGLCRLSREPLASGKNLLARRVGA